MSEETVISLGKERVDRTGNSNDWTVIECLEHALARVKSGEIKPDGVYVAFVQRDEEGSRFPFSMAGLKRLETIGLLYQHLHTEADE